MLDTMYAAPGVGLAAPQIGASERIVVMRFVEGELLRTPLTAEAQKRVHQVNFGIPNLAIFSMLGRSPANPAPAGGHIGFSPVIPRTGESVLEYQRYYRENMPCVGSCDSQNTLSRSS